MTALLIGLAGMIGALLRFGVDSFFAHAGRGRLGKSGDFPLATLAINVVGSFVIGLVGGLSLRSEISAEWQSVLAVGFAGGLTTFSTFAVTTISLWQQRKRISATMNVLLNLALGLSAAGLGLLATS